MVMINSKIFMSSPMLMYLMLVTMGSCLVMLVVMLGVILSSLSFPFSMVQ